MGFSDIRYVTAVRTINCAPMHFMYNSMSIFLNTSLPRTFGNFGVFLMSRWNWHACFLMVLSKINTLTEFLEWMNYEVDTHLGCNGYLVDRGSIDGPRPQTNRATLKSYILHTWQWNQGCCIAHYEIYYAAFIWIYIHIDRQSLSPRSNRSIRFWHHKQM